jgi:hypothetical protein
MRMRGMKGTRQTSPGFDCGMNGRTETSTLGSSQKKLTLMSLYYFNATHYNLVPLVVATAITEIHVGGQDLQLKSSSVIL